MFIAALVKMLPAPKTAVTKADNGYYDQVVHSIFQPGDSETRKNSIIAFSSVSARAGVSFVVREIGLELARYERGRVAIIDVHRLQTISKPDLQEWARLCAASESGLSWLKSDTESSDQDKTKSGKKATLWQSDVVFRRSCLQLLREHFNYVLIDCHSVNSPTTLTVMAKLVDGVVLVASAGQTRCDEIRRAEQVVEIAHGNILGLVLNKRKYPIPGWLYGRI
jgi:protein-tyrosine kinase